MGQTSASNGGTRSGGVYSVRDAVGEPGVGSSSGGDYQVSGGLALGGELPSASTFSLNVTVTGQGTVTLDPSGGVYAAGAVVQLTAAPATGFTFAGWRGAVSSAANTVQVTMDGDKTVTATFSQTPPSNHTLNISVVGQGTVTLDPPGNSYTDGQVVKLTATPSAGFNFTSWGGAVTGAINPITLIMDGDKTVTVTFIQAGSGNTQIYLPVVRR
ncbi:MAG: hypothetical protein U0350_14535 [Caldilineaceae bacterium]